MWLVRKKPLLLVPAALLSLCWLILFLPCAHHPEAVCSIDDSVIFSYSARLVCSPSGGEYAQNQSSVSILCSFSQNVVREFWRGCEGEEPNHRILLLLSATPAAVIVEVFISETRVHSLGESTIATWNWKQSVPPEHFWFHTHWVNRQKRKWGNWPGYQEK